MTRILVGSSLLLAVMVSGPARAEDPSPVIAVFDVETKGVLLGAGVVENLSDYVASRLAESGRYQVVPRDQLKARLVEQKKASYRSCFDQSCQIDLGREMAAQKSMATRVAKLGSQCTVSLQVFDLARAASEAAATAAGPCTEDGIVASIDLAVSKLTGGAAVTPLPTPTPTPARTEFVAPPPVVEDSGPRVKRSAVTAAVGDLTIQAKTPSGAPVRLEVSDPAGREQVSGSPFKAPQAKVGLWKVIARATGHEPEDREINVPPDDVTVVKLELKPLGGLRIVGEPLGTRVRVTGPGDFRDEGGLPWEAEGLRSGSYRVEAEREGYQPETQDVRVEPGRTADATFQLRKKDQGGRGVSPGAGAVNRCDFDSSGSLCGWEANGPYGKTEWQSTGWVRFTNIAETGTANQTFTPVTNRPDIEIQMRMKLIKGQGGVLVGHNWGVEPPDRVFYVFQLYPEGYYKVWQRANQEWKELAKGSVPGNVLDPHVLKLSLKDGVLNAWLDGSRRETLRVKQPREVAAGMTLNDPGSVMLVDWIRVDRASSSY